MTVAELRKRLTEIDAPDNASITFAAPDGTTYVPTFVHPPGWPGGGGTPSIDVEIEPIPSI